MGSCIDSLMTKLDNNVEIVQDCFKDGSCNISSKYEREMVARLFSEYREGGFAKEDEDGNISVFVDAKEFIVASEKGRVYSIITKDNVKISVGTKC